ncbi:AAA family ATPase [Thermophagus sp. OGC60D27]|uniref:AAA family ATPase n=1 Tax=Thermophagus sp. OGC60D27 TaxID=3458415 RepID=UPI004037ABC3
MYISGISIKNYRNFKDLSIEFNHGLNVIIGHNNSGKTNLIKALQLVLGRDLKDKPSIDDFCKYNLDYSEPPSIEISVFINEHDDKEDDKNVVYDWLIRESPEYQAQLTYIFELPTKHHEEYRKLIEECKNENGFDQEKCLKLISKKFLQKYVSRIYGGDPIKQEKANSENLDRFDFQFLDAIRDAERQMFFGNSTLLRDVLNYFLDYDLTNGQGFENLSVENLELLKQREEEFNIKSKELLELLIERIDRDKILQYANETGADIGGEPNFDAEITEQELLFALRLIVEKNGFKLPIKNNGLGYNNLLFIALILAKMQMESSNYMGDNAKVFPVLAIEEPEAHLHPSMQSKFLKFLNTNNQARQIFITSHSTHITSAINLESIICLYEDINGNSAVGYPGKVFSEEDQDSKIYVQRFLDATKSNMLFADKLLFVEGLAEQLLIPSFAQYLEIEDSLVNQYVGIVSVDSRTFKHFLKLFAYDKITSPYAINKKVVCITDADPTIKKGNKWISAFPFELDGTANSKPLSTHVTDLKEKFENKYANIFIFHPPKGTGKTLEYELCKENPTSTLLITAAFPSRNSAHTDTNFRQIVSNYENNLDAIIEAYKEKIGIEDLNKNRILKSISECTWEDETEKKKALIAAIYYTVVSNAKGQHAFYFEQTLREKYKKDYGRLDFKVPSYIENALTEIIKNDA